MTSTNKVAVFFFSRELPSIRRSSRQSLLANLPHSRSFASPTASSSANSASSRPSSTHHPPPACARLQTRSVPAPPETESPARYFRALQTAPSDSPLRYPHRYSRL